MIKWSKKLIILGLKIITKSIGHSPSAREIQPILYQACLRYFGGFNKAKVAAGLRINKIKHNSLPKTSYKPSKELSYIFGVMIGDGNCFYTKSKHGTTGGLILRVKDKDFALNFKKALKVWSGLPVSFSLGSNNLYHVRLCSVEASKFIKSYKLDDVKSLNRVYKCYFLKGLFDSEGSITGKNLSQRSKAARWVGFYNCKENTISLVSHLLKEFEISHKIRSRIHSGFGSTKLQYELLIYGRNNLIKYSHHINFSIRRKQKILKEVLASYLED